MLEAGKFQVGTSNFKISSFSKKNFLTKVQVFSDMNLPSVIRAKFYKKSV